MHPVETQLGDFPRQTPNRARHGWVHKLGVFLFIIVCFEVGAFLTVFPWTTQWDSNAIAHLLPWLRGVWDNSYFRGALSGLGLLNIYISLGEVSRLRRSSGPPDAGPPSARPPAGGLPPADKLKASTL
jgi:hypothetical protein